MDINLYTIVAISKWMRDHPDKHTSISDGWDDLTPLQCWAAFLSDPDIIDDYVPFPPVDVAPELWCKHVFTTGPLLGIQCRNEATHPGDYPMARCKYHSAEIFYPPVRKSIKQFNHDIRTKILSYEQARNDDDSDGDDYSSDGNSQRESDDEDSDNEDSDNEDSDAVYFSDDEVHGIDRRLQYILIRDSVNKLIIREYRSGDRTCIGRYVCSPRAFDVHGDVRPQDILPLTEKEKQLCDTLGLAHV